MTGPPRSIVVVGGCCFGLSTALELANRSAYNATKITLIDMSDLPNESDSSWDINRIARASYTSPLYAALAEKAMNLWQTSAWGAGGRYMESGLLLLGDADATYIGDALNLAKNRGETSQVQEVVGEKQIAEACRTGGSSGTLGYLNRKAGWVDAAKSILFAFEEVKRKNRVEIVKTRVDRLVMAEKTQDDVPTAIGVLLSDGSVLSADLTIVAAGSYSPSLIDMQGIATASAEVLAYIDFTDKELERLQGMPAIINLSKGWFIIPPNGRVLEIARHGLGFSNPVPVQHPMRPDIPQMTMPSLTPEMEESITDAGTGACREALRELVPWLANHKFDRTRICWYTDTLSGDFIIDYHPHYAGLFVATGGTGHAFKFLPVIGKSIVNHVEGLIEQAYRDLWSWPAQKAASEDEVRRRAYVATGGVLD